MQELNDAKGSDNEEFDEDESISPMRTSNKRPVIDEIPIDTIPDVKYRKTAVSQRSGVIEGGLDFDKDDSELGFARRVMFVLEAFFREHLEHYTSQVWYEVVYFRDQSRIVKGFYPPTRVILQSAIENPGHFLKKLNGQVGEAKKQEDLTILYNLYCECGRLINLFDWFTAFKSVVDPNGEQDSKLLQYGVLSLGGHRQVTHCNPKIESDL